MSQISEKNSTHLAGEYFVAAELYRRGYSVAMTLGNAKAIDLFAERGACTVNVQVKAIRDKKSVGWPVMRDRVKDGIIYVFVCLNEAGQPPEYFLCTSAEAREKVKQYATRGVVDLRTLRSKEFQERWDKIETALTAPGNQSRLPARDVTPIQDPKSVASRLAELAAKSPLRNKPDTASENHDEVLYSRDALP